MDNQETYQLAKRRVAMKIAFYIHLAAYGSVNLLLLIINLATSTQTLWFKWSLLGWGIGLGAHALVVYALPKASPMREQMIQREMTKLTH